MARGTGTVDPDKRNKGLSSTFQPPEEGRSVVINMATKMRTKVRIIFIFLCPFSTKTISFIRFFFSYFVIPRFLNNFLFIYFPFFFVFCPHFLFCLFLFFLSRSFRFSFFFFLLVVYFIFLFFLVFFCSFNFLFIFLFFFFRFFYLLFLSL